MRPTHGFGTIPNAGNPSMNFARWHRRMGSLSLAVLDFNQRKIECSALQRSTVVAPLVIFSKEISTLTISIANNLEGDFSDLNPVYNSLDLPGQYKEKYIKTLYPFWKKYNEVLPWGGEISGEALEFLSPFVIWSRPNKEKGVEDVMFEAFKDYVQVWLDTVDKAEAIKNVDEIQKIQELQHRYMLWRKTKDPGRNLLTGLYGEALCEEYMKGFLFAQLDALGTKSFLDYFPHFEDGKGSIKKKRSLTGKSYSTRPWDENGNFIVRASN